MRAPFTIILFISFQFAFGQGKYDANWVFGIKAGINFSDTANPVNFNTLCNNVLSSASISDSSGKLLFYTAPDSFYEYGDYEQLNAIYNAQNEIIAGGDSINQGLILFGALFLPEPETKNYYLFYFNNTEAYDASLNYCKIENDSGTYKVVKKNMALSGNELERRIAAIKHANGNDWWILVHESDNQQLPTNQFDEYLFTKDSIEGPFPQKIGSVHNSYLDAGQMGFSKNGKWFGAALDDQNKVDLFKFDRCTGDLSYFDSINNIDTFGDAEIIACEFSEDESKLYAGEGGGDLGSKSGVYQFNLNSPNINATNVTVFKTDSAQTSFGDLLLAPNNKIYLAVEYNITWPYRETTYNQFNQYLWVINSPDSAGTACNFQPYGYYLGDSARVYYGLPRMPNYNLGELSIYKPTLSQDRTFICKGDSTTKGAVLSIDTVAGVSFSWSAGPGIDSINATEQIVYPTQSTWYYVTFIDTTIIGSCNSRTDSVFVEIRDCDTMGISAPALITPHLFIYPNPAQNITTIEWQPVGEAVQLSVSDLLGRVVRQAHYDPNISKAQIDISGLANGIYVVKLLSANGDAVSGKMAVLHP